ncbi:uncharacterized protein LOC122303162 [Carya illinoinensis]|uniref:Hydroxyproline-rich glycoprotein family protein n=1 Tax=Carya illinoinensis TaxID=32201 RepID=A0A8T1R2A7_CARIL|nr:uncharacterized protein LOC122303162 [Carya illinoinensis]KAG6660322.1 hypothetical protein CIPAW_03G097400 [Carya illinoinensis]
MAEKEFTGNSNRKQARQPPSVPFLWEERPGIPKKDWKPGTSSVIRPAPKPPVKLLVSVPFMWEEKPGTPLPSFSQSPPQESVPPARLSSPPLLLAYACHYNDYDSNYYNDKGGNYGGEGDEEGFFESDIETFSFETDGSCSLAPSLLANCLVPLKAISTAIPVEKIAASEDSDQLETPSSPPSETDSSTSSYVTGISSLVGASFLEHLFPLFPPSSGFLEKVGEEGCKTSLEPKSKHCDLESNSIVVVRSPPTLGELIMMSRRRSYRRKAIQMRNQNLSKELTKKGAFGCFIYKSGSKMIEALYRKRKHLPILKVT